MIEIFLQSERKDYIYTILSNQLESDNISIVKKLYQNELLKMTNMTSFIYVEENTYLTDKKYFIDFSKDFSKKYI